MSVIVSTRNAAADLAPPQVNTGTAPGYDALDLTRGDIASAWKSVSSVLTHDIDVRISPTTPPTLAAVFDARGEGTARPFKVELFRSAAWPVSSPVLVGALSVNGRGDGCILPGSLTGSNGLRFRVTFAFSSRCSVGLVWLGAHTVLPRAYAKRSDAPEYSAVENTSEARSVFAHELADLVEKYHLGFGRLTRTDRDAVRAVFDATRGVLRPLVLLPDHTQMAEVYHGRIGKALPHEVDFPEYNGVRLDFTESGRGLGV